MKASAGGRRALLGGAAGRVISALPRPPSGAGDPVQQVMDNADITWDADAYLPAVKL